MKEWSSIKIFFSIIVSILLFAGNTCAQDKREDYLRFMFYNVENLFDTIDNPTTRDEEFLPKGSRNWNSYRYYGKLKRVFKVIAAVGEWQPPELIGLCEIESRKVITDLVYNTPLIKFDYKYVHYESPDRRGIDVALLYNPDKIKILYSRPIHVSMPNDSTFKTRDVLYSQCLTQSKDTLHVYINHWPSRWGGKLESEHKRELVASIIKKHTDSIQTVHNSPKIIITGDLNDFPADKSVNDVLGAKLEINDISGNSLYNLTQNVNSKFGGTHKYREHWGVFDHFIVSGNLLQAKNIDIENCGIFENEFLLEKDERYLGTKPKRTFIGYKFQEGFSDHLPVYINIRLD